jgi:OmpA-OmpF porin, OOP family
MKNQLFVFFFLGATLQVSAQNEFNKWSVELNGGFNKAMGPLTPGFLSPTLNLGHVDFGARYMINEYLGFKGNLGTGNFREVKGESPEFTTNYQTITLQAVGNLGKILNFESFSEKLGLLGHLGGGAGRIDYKKTARFAGKAEFNYIITSGITTLISLSDRLVLTGDISIFVNGRQTYTLDGNIYNAVNQPDPPFNQFVHATGTWWTGTLGLNFYLGKAEKHADWYFAPEKYATKTELHEAITEIKDMLKDSDGDGIPDYLDQESNTPSGARVNSLGITMDSDGDGTPDHLDNCPFQPGPSSLNGCPSKVEILDEVDYLKKAINDGYVNVYFAFDSSKPLGYSVSAAHYVSNFMKRNPGVRLEIKGYADELGTENYNMKLSERRAKAVYDLMVSSGVDASRLSLKGYGEDTSVDKASPEARQLARRTSFQIL